MSVFRNLDCLSLVVCSNTTLLKLQTVLLVFFSKFCASKSGVRLIYGCGLYTDVYGTCTLDFRFFHSYALFTKYKDQLKKYIKDQLNKLNHFVQTTVTTTWYFILTSFLSLLM